EWNKARKRPALSIGEFDALKDNMTLASALAAEEDSTADVRYGNEMSQDAQIIGATPAFTDIENIDAMNGRLLTSADEERRSSVCILGSDVAAKLFPGRDPVGKEIRAGQGIYTVVGVAVPQGSVFGQSQDNYVMIPLGTYRKEWLTPDDSVTIFIQSRSQDAMPAAEDEARVILRSLRHVRYEDDDNFAMIEPTSITGLWNRITGSAFGIAIWITSVFLVVGGIVIMNIMLASVTERTREIGLRKSLGARRRHIVMQFLVESSLLAASGGFLGVVIAVGVAQIVRLTTPIPISTPFFAVAIALFLSTAVGLFFGIYPAVRASRLSPIEALRAEN
ncbi:MAG: ABC transporter permease, partial [Candidatus Acidiferrales bacterium]